MSRIALRITLRVFLASALSTLIIPASFASPSPETRSAIFVMGPVAGDSAGPAVRSAAFACRRWLKEPGATAELRHAGGSEGVALDKTPAKELDGTFAKAAKDAADRDPADLVSTLDDAVHALANRSGLRVAVAVVDVAALPSETEESFRQIIQFATDNSVRIVLLDPSKASLDTAGDIWKLAGSTTNGAFLQDTRSLTSAMLSATGVKPTAADAPPALAQPAPVQAKSDLKTDLPVFVRFIQVSNRSGATQYQTAQLGVDSSGAGTGGNLGESASRVEGAGGPLHGYLIVQAPMSALHFDKDDRTGSYSAHAVMNVKVVSASGKTAGKDAWHATKDVKISGQLAKFHEREGGNLYLMREVQLPGGQYTLQASVQDVLVSKSASVTEPLKTGSGVPGLMVSDALFVKPLKGSVDKLEGDIGIDYQGNSLGPMLGPVFPANTPFSVDVYFILYPDVYGPPPQITMEILQDGKVVSQANMPFKSMLRNSAQEGRGTELHGSLQHGFDYLASMKVDKMSPAECQARLTIRQGTNTVTRLVDFRVADTGAVAQKATEPKTSN